MPLHAYLPRSLQPEIKRLFSEFPVVVIVGARQVGKSTLLEEAFEHKIPRIVFDPLIDVASAKGDPDLFLNNQSTPVILDEIQYAPQLVPAIKRKLEKDRSPGQYLITGSQQWQVMKLLAESLAGRAIILNLHNFSLSEIHGRKSWLEPWLNGETAFEKGKTKIPLYEQLWRGFFPEAQFIDLKSIPYLFESYIATYIEKDARLMAEVSDWQLFSRFYRLCAALTAQEINHSELGRDIGVTPQTAARWLDILRATFQWHDVPAYSRNAVKRVSLKPKGYFLDTGLTCWSFGLSSPQAIASHPQWGALFETAVINEIKKQCASIHPPPQMYHWRIHGGSEVDAILEWNGKVYPIEIKSNSHPAKKDSRGIQIFMNDHARLPVEKGLVVAPCDSFYPISENIFAMPWDALVKTG